jgi:hypothetical protein
MNSKKNAIVDRNNYVNIRLSVQNVIDLSDVADIIYQVQVQAHQLMDF